MLVTARVDGSLAIILIVLAMAQQVLQVLIHLLRHVFRVQVVVLAKLHGVLHISTHQGSQQGDHLVEPSRRIHLWWHDLFLAFRLHHRSWRRIHLPRASSSLAPDCLR